jgi:hypothetical protein
MSSAKSAARWAGVLYVMTSIPGAWCLVYLPSHFIVPGDATATAGRIVAGELLFRLGIVAELLSFTGFLFVALALFRLLRGVNPAQAWAMVLLIGVSIPVSLINTLNEWAALYLIRGVDVPSALSVPQRQAWGMVFLQFHSDGLGIAGVFWGLWLIPFGTLVYQSKFFPRALGVLLWVAAVGNLARSLVGFGVLPDALDGPASMLAHCELAMILWLVIRGAKDVPLPPG